MRGRPRINTGARARGSSAGAAQRVAPIFAFCLLVSAATAFGLPLYLHRSIEEADFLVGLLTLTTVFPMLHALWSEDGDFFSPVPLVSGLMILYYIVRALSLRFGPVQMERLAPNLKNGYMEFITPSLELILLCWIAALVVCYSPLPGLIVTNLLPKLTLLSSPVRPNRLVVLVAVGLATRIYLLATHQYSAFLKLDTDVNTVSYLGYAAGFLTTAVALYAASYFKGTLGAANSLLLWGLAFPTLIIFGLLAGGKMMIVLPLVMTGAAYHYFRQRLRLRHIAAFTAIVALVIVPIVGAYRGTFQDDNNQARDVGQNSEMLGAVLQEYGRSDDFWFTSFEAVTNRLHGLDSTLVALKMTPAYIPYQDGSLYWQFPLIALIPRIIWHGKPKNICIPTWEVEYWGWENNDGGSVADTQIGALYCAFGFWGAVLGFTLHLLGLQVVYLFLKANWGFCAFAMWVGVLPEALRLENELPGLWGGIIQQAVVTMLALQLIRERSPSKPRGASGGSSAVGPLAPTPAGQSPYHSSTV